MGRITIEDLLSRSDGSVYGLVRMAANRALELSEGKKPMVEVNTDKLTTIALQEILQGKIEAKSVAEKRASAASPNGKDSE